LPVTLLLLLQLMTFAGGAEQVLDCFGAAVVETAFDGFVGAVA
jgi:hypothetical protein